MANISFDPAVTSAPQTSFVGQTQGYYQGDFVDDPSTRMYLNSGKVDAAVTQPVWGGMVIQELVPTAGTSPLGSDIALAAGYTSATGMTVFTQAYNMVIVPGNTVQTSSAGMTVSYFRFGSGARIRVQASSALATAVEGNQIDTQVSWDFTNQILVPFSTTALPVKVLSVDSNSKIVNYNSGTGATTWTSGIVAEILI